MREIKNQKKARLIFGKGSSALAQMDEFMEKHADKIEELERRFGSETAGQHDDNANATTVAPLKKAA